MTLQKKMQGKSGDLEEEDQATVLGQAFLPVTQHSPLKMHQGKKQDPDPDQTSTGMTALKETPLTHGCSVRVCWGLLPGQR